jgi:hypothetical protein
MVTRFVTAAIAALDPDSRVVTQLCVTAEQQNSSSGSTSTLEYQSRALLCNRSLTRAFKLSALLRLLASTCRVRYCCQQQQAALFNRLIPGIRPTSSSINLLEVVSAALSLYTRSCNTWPAAAATKVAAVRPSQPSAKHQ